MIILLALALNFLKTFRFLIYHLHHILEISSTCMYLEAVSNNEVNDIILNLNNASPGWDNISAKIVQQT